LKQPKSKNFGAVLLDLGLQISIGHDVIASSGTIGCDIWQDLIFEEDGKTSSAHVINMPAMPQLCAERTRYRSSKLVQGLEIVSLDSSQKMDFHWWAIWKF
jgi:hypothetical protein